MYYLARLEETGFSIWVRESDWGFFTALTFHSLTLGLVVGINIAINLRVLGVAPKVPLQYLPKFFPLMNVGLLLVICSGLILLVAYPAKALSNEIFYLKIGAITLALLLTRHFAKTLMLDATEATEQKILSKKWLAGLALSLWVFSVGAGRFLAYTHSVLLASRFY